MRTSKLFNNFNVGDNVKTVNSQLEKFKNINSSFPAREKICSILGISFQSTHEEILHAHQEQVCFIESLVPKDSMETALLEEKHVVLSQALEAYNEELKKKGTPNIASSIELAKHKYNRSNTMYSFHIPCIFWCMFKGVDCVWNCCCAGCSCCGDSYDCWSECYKEDGACDCLRPVDTVIAIVGMIAGVIWLISKIGPGISDAASTACADRSRRKADREKQRFVQNYQKNYLPRVIRAYEEWSDLRNYNVDIRTFLHRISSIRVDDQTDAEYIRMQEAVDKEYTMIENRWGKLQVYLDELKSTNNSSFYSYLKNEAPGREKYIEMFNSRKNPWIK